jgi:ABC-type lipoprotein export system ATPase subunit
MSDPLLSAKGLGKTYLLGKRSLEVLRGVEVELQRGDFITLRGASGSGKSTLLHLLGGLDSPTHGEVWLAGRNLAKLSRNELARVRLADRVEHKPYELSGGEQQRVAIARALINDPALILADEPTGNLDSRTGHEIISLLRSLRDEKKTTLVMATHDAALAASAPRTLELVDGEIRRG